MKCDCGGTLASKRLERFDFTPLAGIRCELLNVSGLRCRRCGYETLSGDEIARALDVLAIAVVKMEPRLAREPAVFLRKRLRLTQQALADRMGITRETVAKWESGMTEISAAHDALLRMLVLSRQVGDGRSAEVLSALRSLDHVRTKAPRRPPPFILGKELSGRARKHA